VGEMDRDYIIKLAREAGIVVTGEAIWKLCELVAAHEREACARLLEDYDRFGDTRDCAAAIRARGQA